MMDGSFFASGRCVCLWKEVEKEEENGNERRKKDEKKEEIRKNEPSVKPWSF